MIQYICEEGAWFVEDDGMEVAEENDFSDISLLGAVQKWEVWHGICCMLCGERLGEEASLRSSALIRSGTERVHFRCLKERFPGTWE